MCRPRCGPELTGATAVPALGPYFAADEYRPGQEPAAPWRPMIELVDHSEVLRQRVESVRQILAAGAGVEPADIEWRVAASTVHLGLVARLVAPALAIAVLANRSPAWELADCFWQPVLGGPFPLSLPEQAVVAGVELDVEFSTWITSGPIEQCNRAIQGSGSISHRVLLGNVASAVHGAAQQIMIARPDLSRSTTALLNSVGHRAPLSGAGRIAPSGRFRRTSCCLIYRAARPLPIAEDRVVCGDCVLGID